MSSDALNAVLDCLTNVRETGPGQYRASCPHHRDRTPSLSVSEGDTQPVVFNCHAGCDREQILDSLGFRWSELCSGDVVTQADFEQEPWKYGEKVATYHYEDEFGENVYRVERYEHSEHGWKSFRPYLPGNKRAGLGKQDRVLYRLPSVIKHAQGSRVVFVVEGEKDVHSLEQRGFTATTSGSSDTWEDRFSEWLSGAKVVVIPDNDDSGRSYACQVAASCRKAADWVRVLHLDEVPPGGDVTDWFAQGHERSKLVELIASLDDWTSDMGYCDDGTVCNTEVEVSWGKVRALYDQDKKSKARLEAAKAAVGELVVATHRASGALYAFDEEHGVMQRGGDRALGELLLEELGPRHSRHEHKEIRAKVKALTYREKIGRETFIPVANGDLELRGRSYEPHLQDIDPERAPLHRSPAAWDLDAQCPLWRKHLQENVGSAPERETLQEYAGYGLLHWQLPFHKALFLTGPTASGKSTTVKMFHTLYGRATSLSPQKLVNGRFGPAELERAWANLRSDIPSALLKNVGLFKEITAGDPIHVERKYERGYTIEPKAKHLYSANRLPDVDIDDNAFYRRVMIVSFPDTIPQEDQEAQMNEALREELDGVLQWAVAGLRRLLQNEGFTYDLPPEDTRREWDAHATSIGRFKADLLEVTGDCGNDFEPKDRVFNAYAEFCEDNGLEKESQRQLTRTLKKDSRISDADRTPSGRSSQVSCYTGILLRQSNPELPR